MATVAVAVAVAPETKVENQVQKHHSNWHLFTTTIHNKNEALSCINIYTDMCMSKKVVLFFVLKKKLFSL